MSFSYDPYRHIEVTHEPHGTYKLLCSSCGKHWGDWKGQVPASFLFSTMADHVLHSHARTREDFAGWGIV